MEGFWVFTDCERNVHILEALCFQIVNRNVVVKILGNPKRMALLEEVLFSDSPIKVNEIAKNKKMSSGFVSKYLQNLKKIGVVKKRKEGYVVMENPVTRSLRLLLNSLLFQKINLKKYMIQGSGVYGSWARGENKRGSDIDIWIFSERKMGEEEISEISAEIRKKTGSEVDLMALNPEKLSDLRKNERLYCSLREGIVIYGKGLDELERLYS